MERSIHVLHVDDEPDLGDVVATFLERKDDRLDVRTATSVADGLEHLTAHSIDCIVSDYEMPGQNGVEFLRAVREEHPDLPFILYTGKGSEEVAGEAISAGVTDYLQKEGGTEQYTILANRITNAVEQYRSRREIERSEARLREVVDALPHLLYVIDEEGNYLLANEALADFHDTTVAELEGSHVEEILAEPVVERLWEDLSTVFEAGELVQYPVVEIEDADGTPRVLEPRLLPFDYGESSSRTALGFAVDVTERQRHERELGQVERRYRAIFEDPNILVAVLDTDGTLLEVNRTAMEYIDTAAEELVGEQFWETPWWDGARTRIRRHVERAAENEYVPFEAALTTAGGEPYNVSGVIRPVTDEADQVVSLVVSARDITGRRERERELEDTTERLELALAASNLGVYDWNVQTDEITFDDRVAALLGYEPDEFDDDLSDWIERTHPDDLPTVQENLDMLFEGEANPPQSEYRVRSKGGDWLWVRSMGTVVEWTDTGEPLRVMGVHQDITESKEQELTLKRERDRLDEFASIVSHDLRSPLSVAEGRLELARTECNTAHLDDVTRAHERMETLIDDLLTLAREGETVTEPESVALTSLVEECLATIETAKTTLVVDTDRTVRADRSRLQQLFENLIRNSVEHGGEGVTVTVGDIEDGFYVADDGPGIPEESRDEVFEAGYSTSEAGTGFGLRIVEQIVRAHDWEIAVTESAAGGARFEIRGVDTVENHQPAP